MLAFDLIGNVGKYTIEEVQANNENSKIWRLLCNENSQNWNIEIRNKLFVDFK